MTSNALYIELSTEQDGEYLYVGSPQIPGLHLLGPSLRQMKPVIEHAVRRLLHDNDGINVAEILWLEALSGQDELKGLAVRKMAA